MEAFFTGLQARYKKITCDELGRLPKFHQESSTGSKVIQQSYVDGQMDRRTDGQTDRRTDNIPLPLCGRVRIFFCVNFLPFHSLRSLTLLVEWKKNNNKEMVAHGTSVEPVPKARRGRRSPASSWSRFCRQNYYYYTCTARRVTKMVEFVPFKTNRTTVFTKLDYSVGANWAQPNFGWARIFLTARKFV
jgi:hypothetical protein